MWPPHDAYDFLVLVPRFPGQPGQVSTSMSLQQVAETRLNGDKHLAVSGCGVIIALHSLPFIHMLSHVKASTCPTKGRLKLPMGPSNKLRSGPKDTN